MWVLESAAGVEFRKSLIDKTDYDAEFGGKSGGVIQRDHQIGDQSFPRQPV